MDVMKIKVTVYLKGQGVIEGFELDTTPRIYNGYRKHWLHLR
jgi:hypothetical protein